MRVFYNLLVTLGLPFVALYWCWRACVDKAYRQNIGQRFGFGYPRFATTGRVIWIHAVSVGEVQASAPLVNALRTRLPDAEVLITTVTPTGRDRVQLLFGDTVKHAFAPYDVLPAVRRFYNAINPDLAVIVETELWPNLYGVAGRRGVPLILASARISPRSMPRYRRLVGLFREALSNGIIIAAQSETDRQRFEALGAPADRTFVSGNIKFDFRHAPDLRDRGAALRANVLLDRITWVAASTHDGEEDILLDGHRALLEAEPDALLVIAPRHPQRFDEVAEKLEGAGLIYQRRTDAEPVAARTNVLLADTMGEVNLFYAAADIAFVGGSLVPIGGHNLLEPAALGLPILTGPHLYNAEDIARMFREYGAVKTVANADELSESLAALYRRPSMRERMGKTGWRLVADNRGAVDRLLEKLEPVLGIDH